MGAQESRDDLNTKTDCNSSDEQDEKPYSTFLGHDINNLPLCGSSYCIPPSDDGIPPCCHSQYCPLDPRFMKFIHCECIANYIGTIGFRYFDIHRKFFMGVASWVCVFALLLMLWGCIALSTNGDIVKVTSWATASGENMTSGEHFDLYIGLRSITYVTTNEEITTEWGYYSYITGYIGDRCKDGLLEDACFNCSVAASSQWFLVVSSCFWIILSFLGAQARLRGTVSDFPIQKILGMFSEMNGFISLIMGLLTFRDDCFNQVKDAWLSDKDLDNVNFNDGPGYICFAICAAVGVGRTILHWLTPLPKQGRGFIFIFSDLYALFSKCCCKQVIEPSDDQEFKNQATKI